MDQIAHSNVFIHMATKASTYNSIVDHFIKVGNHRGIFAYIGADTQTKPNDDPKIDFLLCTYMGWCMFGISSIAFFFQIYIFFIFVFFYLKTKTVQYLFPIFHTFNAFIKYMMAIISIMGI